MIEARVVCDSIAERSPRLTTFFTRYPRFVHDEHLRHRAMSFSVSSSRAIPVAKKLEEVRSEKLRAAPVFWGAEQKGMSPGGELAGYPQHFGVYDNETYTSPKVEAQIAWAHAAHDAAHQAEKMVKIGVHKSIINRLLDPFCHCNVLCTATEPGLLNFFGLRLDKAAEPTIRALAEAMWAAWQESTPRKLNPGDWHLPFVDDDEDMGHPDVYVEPPPDSTNGYLYYSRALKVSTARCARLSYTSFETGKRSTVKEDLALYERLVGSHPIHASPAEHQATPDVLIHTSYGPGPSAKPNADYWKQAELHGNLHGWVQFRKTLPGEAVAPLPKEYQTNPCV